MGSALIAALFLHFFYHFSSLFTFPVIAAQVLVVAGGGSSLVHYYCLKRLNRDIFRLTLLERSSVYLMLFATLCA